MKLVVGTYILDNVTSTAYEEFVSYYSSTPASYITNADIERWNTRDDISQMVTYSYLSEKLADIDVSGSVDLSSYATISYVTQLSYELEKDEKVIAAAFNNINDKISYTVSYTYLSEITQNTYSYISEKVSDKVSYSYLTEALSDKATYSYLSYNFIDKWNLGSYVSELVGESTDNDVSNETISQSLNELKLDLDYNAGLVSRINSKYASKNYVDNNYMTKTLAYNTINTYLNSYVSNETRLSDITNLNSYLTNISNTYIKGELQTISFALNDLSYRVDNINIPDASNFVSYSYITEKLSGVPELINIPDLNGKYVSSEELKGIVQKTEYENGTADYRILGFNDDNLPVYRHLSLEEDTDTGELIPVEEPEIVIKPDVADITWVSFGDYGNYVTSKDYPEDFKGIAVNSSEDNYKIIGFDENDEPIIRYLAREYDTDIQDYRILDDIYHIASQEYVDEAIVNLDIPDASNFVSKDELPTFSYNIIPNETNTYNLGALTYIWSNVYTQTIDGGNGGRLNLRIGGTNRLVLFPNRLYPHTNNYTNLGVESNAWKDTYTYNLYIWDGSSFADLGSYIRNIIQNG